MRISHLFRRILANYRLGIRELCDFMIYNKFRYLIFLFKMYKVFYLLTSVFNLQETFISSFHTLSLEVFLRYLLFLLTIFRKPMENQYQIRMLMLKTWKSKTYFSHNSMKKFWSHKMKLSRGSMLWKVACYFETNTIC